MMRKPVRHKGFAGKLNYLTIKDGESKVVRFLTDDVLTVQFYEYVVNNQGKFQTSSRHRSALR